MRYSFQIKTRMQFWNSSPCQTWNKSHQPQAWPPSGLESGGGSLPQPPCRAWSCRPWRTWPRMTKFAWKYAVIHYSKSPWPKNNKKLWSGEFFLKISIFSEAVKIAQIRSKNTFLIFCLKNNKKIFLCIRNSYPIWNIFQQIKTRPKSINFEAF